MIIEEIKTPHETVPKKDEIKLTIRIDKIKSGVDDLYTMLREANITQTGQVEIIPEQSV